MEPFHIKRHAFANLFGFYLIKFEDKKSICMKSNDYCQYLYIQPHYVKSQIFFLH